jgi:pyrroline-5-carboxylate reductase
VLGGYDLGILGVGEIGAAIVTGLCEGAGVTPVYPGTAAALALFGRLGGAAEVDDAGTFDAMSAASGTVAAYLRYLAEISGWLSGQGVAPGQAERYVRSVFAGLADDLADSSKDLGQLAGEHATPGGINERFREMLEQDGVFRAVSRSLQDIYEGLKA